VRFILYNENNPVSTGDNLCVSFRALNNTINYKGSLCFHPNKLLSIAKDTNLIHLETVTLTSLLPWRFCDRLENNFSAEQGTVLCLGTGNCPFDGVSTGTENRPLFRCYIIKDRGELAIC